MKKTSVKILIGYIVLAIPVIMYLVNLNKEDKSVQSSSEKTYNEASGAFTNTHNSEKESKRVKLYIAAMKETFKMGNGGNGFIAVEEETLEGLEDKKSKEEVLEGLKSLSPNVYWYEEVKNNKALFEFDEKGGMMGTLNGTLLSVKVVELKDDKATIEAISGFGNLGAVLLKYKAVYKNDQWELKVVSKAIS